MGGDLIEVGVYSLVLDCIDNTLCEAVREITGQLFLYNRCKVFLADY